MILSDVLRALGQMGDRRLLGVLGLAIALTLALLAGFVWLLVMLFGWLLPDILALPFIGEVSTNVAWWGVLVLALVASVFLMVPMASFLVGFFVERVADAVEDRHYPALGPARRQGMAEILLDTLGFLGLMVFANSLALIAYLVLAPVAPFVFWAVNGFLLGREYFTLVAVRRFERRAARDLRKRHAGQIWLLGVLMAVPLTVPVLNLAVPVLGVAAFTHLFHRVAAHTP